MIKGMIRLGLTLAAFAAFACVGLALVNQVTEKAIAGNQEKQLSESLRGLFEGADAFEDVSADVAWTDPDVKLDKAYAVTRGGILAGVAVKASGNSYGGISTILVGVSPDGRIAGVRVLENRDTPGLGANAAVPTYFVDKSRKTTWPGQFAGKALTDKFVVKEDVSAITASTITSVALTKIIKASADAAAVRLAGLAQGGK